jgi:hypothetical protein
MARNADAREAVPGAAASALGQEIVAAENSATATDGQAERETLTRWAGIVNGARP